MTIVHTTATAKEIANRKGFARRVINRLHQISKKSGVDWGLNFIEETHLAGGVGTRFTAYGVEMKSGSTFALYITVSEYEGKQVAVLSTPAPTGSSKFVSSRITNPDTLTAKEINWKGI